MSRSRLTLSITGLVAGLLSAASAGAQTTERVSMGVNGSQANHHSALFGRSSAISADGLIVAFESQASNLVINDSNIRTDVFVYDRQTGLMTRVSVNSIGGEGNGDSRAPALSADGRFVAFSSLASHLVFNDVNRNSDVFVHDRATGITSMVSLTSAGGQGDGSSMNPALSADGRFVAFRSTAWDLVLGDTNGAPDVFLHDRQTGETRCVSVSSAGAVGSQGADGHAISADGRYVAFASASNNLVAGDLNGWADVFIHDVQTGQTSLISVDSAGVQGNSYSNFPALSADGQHVAFRSPAHNLVPGDTNLVEDIFVHDRSNGVTRRVSVDSQGAQANDICGVLALSADGGTVVFESAATNLVAGDSNARFDIFAHTLASGQTARVSVAVTGAEGNGDSANPVVSADARFVGFSSRSRQLVLGDTNDRMDVFVHDRQVSGPTLALSGSCPGQVTFTIEHATPGGPVTLACGSAGLLVRSSPPCAGLLLGIRPPILTVQLTADAAGTASLTQNLSAGLCGRSVQAVDRSTCAATQVIVL